MDKFNYTPAITGLMGIVTGFALGQGAVWPIAIGGLIGILGGIYLSKK